MDAFGPSQGQGLGDDDWERKLRSIVQMKRRAMTLTVSLEDTVSVEASRMMLIEEKNSRLQSHPNFSHVTKRDLNSKV
jgi:hypothetical protein